MIITDKLWDVLKHSPQNNIFYLATGHAIFDGTIPSDFGNKLMHTDPIDTILGNEEMD